MVLGSKDPQMLGVGEYCVETIDQLQPDIFNKWWLIRVKSRQEKELARELLERRVAYYLPLTRFDSKALCPMFTGYMFLYGTAKQTYKALSTPKRVVQILPIENQMQTHWELVGIDRTVQSGLTFRVMSRLSKGDVCEVVEGALKGQVGRVDSISGDDLWVSVWISILGQSIMTKIPHIHVDLSKDLTKVANEQAKLSC